MDPGTILLRFFLAFAGSFVYGLARQRQRKPIGFGTFIFVALGSCGLALTALETNPENPLPLLSAIVTGIGFLGAGALFRTPDRIVGFTSAAAIWIFAVFGLTLGSGEYLVGALVYASIWGVTFVDGALARRWIGAHQRKLTVRTRLDIADVEIEELLGLPPRHASQALAVDREQASQRIVFVLDRRRTLDEGLLSRLDHHEKVLGYEIE